MEWNEPEVYLFLAAAVLFLLRLYLYLRGHISPLILSTRHVLVTGGSSGLGKELAKECFLRGANVTIIARDMKRLEQAEAEIEALRPPAAGNKIMHIQANVTKEDQINSALVEAEVAFGPIFLFIACAGNVNPGFLDADMKEYRDAFEENFLGTLYPTHAVAKRMKVLGNGYICLVSSAAVLLRTPGLAPMTPAKAAVKALADSIRFELRRSNVSVHVFYPPSMDTDSYRQSVSRKSELTQKCEGSPISPRQACLALLSGVSAGDSDITTDDTTSFFSIISQSGGRRSLFLLDLMLAPLSVVVGHVRAKVMQLLVRKAKTRRHL